MNTLCDIILYSCSLYIHSDFEPRSEKYEDDGYYACKWYKIVFKTYNLKLFSLYNFKTLCNFGYYLKKAPRPTPSWNTEMYCGKACIYSNWDKAKGETDERHSPHHYVRYHTIKFKIKKPKT